MKDKLDDILNRAIKGIHSSTYIEELESTRINILGRKGELTSILRSLGQMTPEERTTIGKRANEIKLKIENALEDKKNQLSTSKIDRLLKEDWIDVTLDLPDPPKAFRRGHLHPLSAIQYEIEDIFSSMGFQIMDGPEVETEYYNFEALNIPKHHPARDMQDTYWTEDWNLLRTQTSSIQIRGMEKLKPPFRIIGPGRVFRHETADSSHDDTFNQIEGLMVDRDISIAHLNFFLKQMLKEIFHRNIDIRLRPGFFPFVEPGFEYDIQCSICNGKGCAACKNSGWIELSGCGLVHPNVLKYVGIDPSEWFGFAFGFGLERLVMMLHGITDIRHFLSGDIRFLEQF